VTRFPFGAGCEVIGADSVGFDDVIVRATNTTDFQDAVRRLIADPALRAELGERTRATIEATNMGDGWMQALTALYVRAFEVSRHVPGPPAAEAPSFEDCDLFLPFVFGNVAQGDSPAARRAIATEIDLRVLPVGWRLNAWAGMAWNRQFAFRKLPAAWRYLLPEWLSCRASDLASMRT
jgi:hypothetical protein